MSGTAMSSKLHQAAGNVWSLRPKKKLYLFLRHRAHWIWPPALKILIGFSTYLHLKPHRNMAVDDKWISRIIMFYILPHCTRVMHLLYPRRRILSVVQGRPSRFCLFTFVFTISHVSPSVWLSAFTSVDIFRGISVQITGSCLSNNIHGSLSVSWQVQTGQNRGNSG